MAHSIDPAIRRDQRPAEFRSSRQNKDFELKRLIQKAEMQIEDLRKTLDQLKQHWSR